MNTHYGLSEIEYELMEYFWEKNEVLGFSDVVHFCNEINGHDWAATTIHTYLTRLIKKGVLSSTRKGYNRSYVACVTKEELAHKWADKFVAESFGGSIKKLLVSLTYQTSLTSDEVTELHQLLENSMPQKEEPDETAD